MATGGVDPARARARDRDIFTDLAKLGSEVSALQKNITNRRPGGSPGQAGVAPGPGHPRVGNQWVDDLIQSHQEEYCRMKDLHFEETRALNAEIHELRKRLHISGTDLEISNHNCKELQRVLADKDAGVETATLKQALRMKEMLANRLTSQNREAERQIAELRASLEEAIQAISKQYKENSALVKKVKLLGKVMSPQERDGEAQVTALAAELKEAKEATILLEKDIWRIGEAAGAQPEADFQSVLRIISAKVESARAPAPEPSNTGTDGAQDLIVTQLKADLAKKESSLIAQKKNGEMKVKKYLVEIQEKSTVIHNMTKEKATLVARIAELSALSEEGAAGAVDAQAAAAASARISELEGQVAQQLAAAEGVSAELQEKADAERALRVECSTLQAQLAVARASSSEATGQEAALAELREQLGSATAREGVLKESLAEAEAALRAAGEQHAEQQRGDAVRAASAATELSAAQAELAQLRQEVQTQQKESTRSGVDATEHEFLQKQVSSLQQENDTLRGDNAQQLRSLRDSTDELSSLRDAAEALHDQAARKDALVETLEVQLRSLEQSHAELQQQAAQKEQAAEEPAAPGAVNSLAQVSEAYAELSTYTSELQRAYKARLAQQVTLSQALQAAREAGPPGGTPVADLQKQLDDEKKKRESRVADLKRQIMDLNKEKNTLRKRVTELESSK